MVHVAQAASDRLRSQGGVFGALTWCSRQAHRGIVAGRERDRRHPRTGKEFRLACAVNAVFVRPDRAPPACAQISPARQRPAGQPDGSGTIDERRPCLPAGVEVRRASPCRGLASHPRAAIGRKSSTNIAELFVQVTRAAPPLPAAETSCHNFILLGSRAAHTMRRFARFHSREEI